jgi:transcriptional regulator PpsR
VKSLQSPGTSLGDLSAESAAKLIAATADVALVMDRQGVIRDIAYDGDELAAEGCASWLGRPWIETVTVESRPKVTQLLKDAVSDAEPKWRQINHASPKGPDLPIRYSAVGLGEGGRIVAIGRDLRNIASLQQRLVEAQQTMEREYARLRQSETRYRALFQLSSEAVLIVDANSLKVVEANPAAVELFAGAKRLPGRNLVDLFQPEDAPSAQRLLGAVWSSPRAEEAKLRLSDEGGECSVQATLFRQDNNAYFLVRLSRESAEANAVSSPRVNENLYMVVETMPDGFVITDAARRILTANTAFLDLAQLATEAQAKGQPIDRWLGRVPVDVDILLANAREHGSVRQFRSVMRGEYGATEDIEASAVFVPKRGESCYGFTLRKIQRNPAAIGQHDSVLPRSVRQMTELVGRVPLKDLVRETTDIIERLCIEAALELTDDNRASAAEMLGLSRQSLYVKLRRYGLGAPAEVSPWIAKGGTA